jgi:hypothetical protein
MGMIISRVESVCCMCDRAVGRGKWYLCAACEAETADQIARRLGSPICRRCGEQNAVHGLCTKCRSTIIDAENAALEPDDEKAEKQTSLPPIDV